MIGIGRRRRLGRRVNRRNRKKIRRKIRINIKTNIKRNIKVKNPQHPPTTPKYPNNNTVPQ